MSSPGKSTPESAESPLPFHQPVPISSHPLIRTIAVEPISEETHRDQISNLRDEIAMKQNEQIREREQDVDTYRSIQANREILGVDTPMDSLRIDLEGRAKE
jgi:hypothetical protein